MNNKRRPEKIRVDYDDLEEGKMNDYTGGAYRNYKGKPFTGFALDGYYENGQVAGEREYVNGEDIGWIISYYDNGNIEYESLDYGATNVFFKEYDYEGNSLGSHFFAPELLEKVCAITGEDPENVK